MGILILIGSIIGSMVCIFASMAYLGEAQFVLGGVLFVLGIVIMIVGGKFYRKNRLAGDDKFFQENEGASIVRIMHKPKREVVYLYDLDDKALASKPEATLFASTIYLTYGIKSGSNTVKATFNNKRDLSFKIEEQTITLDILPRKYYELKYNKDSKTFVLKEAQLPKDLKRYQQYLGN